MRKALDARTLILQVIIFLCYGCGSACAFIGADAADPALQRYTVAVTTATGNCSGVVLAQSIVLTAAHCVQASPNVQVHGNPVVETVLHPLYISAETDTPDLAILRLARPLPDRFIPVTVDPRNLSKGIDLIAAGYGKSSIVNDYLTGTALRMVLLRVLDTTRDWAILVSVREEGSGAGPGDSGSPVYTYRGMHSLVALIVARSKDDTKTLIKAVALAAHYRWIMDTVQKLSGA
jgi:hypothetical protein